jgi:hypothetical protein
MLTAAISSETSVTFYEATGRNISEDSHFFAKVVKASLNEPRNADKGALSVYEYAVRDIASPFIISSCNSARRAYKQSDVSVLFKRSS